MNKDLSPQYLYKLGLQATRKELRTAQRMMAEAREKLLKASYPRCSVCRVNPLTILDNRISYCNSCFLKK